MATVCGNEEASKACSSQKVVVSERNAESERKEHACRACCTGDCTCAVQRVPPPFPVPWMSVTNGTCSERLAQRSIEWYFGHSGSSNGLLRIQCGSNSHPSLYRVIVGGDLAREVSRFGIGCPAARKDFLTYPVRAHVRAALLDDSTINLQPYVFPVSRLLKLGRPTSGQSFDVNFSAADVPLLLQMASDRTLLQAAGKSRKKWGPVHAVRALGTLNEGAKLVNLLDLHDAWYQAELPKVIARAGIPAFWPSLDYLQDGRRWMKGRIAAVEIVDQILQSYKDSDKKLRSTTVQVFKELLSRQSTQASLATTIIGTHTWSTALHATGLDKSPKVQGLWLADRLTTCYLCHRVEERDFLEGTRDLSKHLQEIGKDDIAEEYKCWWEPLRKGSKHYFADQKMTEIQVLTVLCQSCEGGVCSSCADRCVVCDEIICHLCFSFDCDSRLLGTVCVACSRSTASAVISRTVDIDKCTLSARTSKDDMNDIDDPTARKRIKFSELCRGTLVDKNGLNTAIASTVGLHELGKTNSTCKSSTQDTVDKNKKDIQDKKKAASAAPAERDRRGRFEEAGGGVTKTQNGGPRKTEALKKGLHASDGSQFSKLPEMPSSTKAMKSAASVGESSSGRRSNVADFFYVMQEVKSYKEKGNAFFKDEQYLAAMQEYVSASELCKRKKDLLEESAGLELARLEYFQLRSSVFLNMAACQLKLGKYKAAIDNCTLAIAAGDENRCAKAFFRRGVAYFNLGQLTDAYTDLTMALQRLPGDRLVQQELNRVTEALATNLEMTNSKKKPQGGKKGKSSGSANESKKSESKKGTQEKSGGDKEIVVNKGAAVQEKSEPADGSHGSAKRASNIQGGGSKDKPKVAIEKEKKANKAKKAAEKAARRAEEEKEARLKQQQEEEEYQRALEQRRKELEEEEIREVERKINEREELERKSKAEEAARKRAEEAREKLREEKLACLQAKISAADSAREGQAPRSRALPATAASATTDLKEIFPFFFPAETHRARPYHLQPQAVSTAPSSSRSNDMNGRAAALAGGSVNDTWGQYQDQNERLWQHTTSGPSGNSQVAGLWQPPGTQYAAVPQRSIQEGPHFISPSEEWTSQGWAAFQGPLQGSTATSGATPLRSGSAFQNDVEDATCAICMEAERDALVLPCSHLSTCSKCIQMIKASSRALCPICRVPITSIIKLDVGPTKPSHETWSESRGGRGPAR